MPPHTCSMPKSGPCSWPWQICNGCELTEELNLAQSKLSFQPKVKKDSGLLESRKEGRWVYYRQRSEPIGALH